jgi:MFS family permease
METTQPKPLTFGEVWQITAFRRLWFGQLVSLFGDFLALFAVLSHVSFKLHATPAQVTFISVTFLLPFATVGPLAGVFVDRWDVKRTMIASDLIRMALIITLIFIPNLYGIYALLLTLSLVSTFFVPAQVVALRMLVPPHGLFAANGLMQQAMQVIRIVTPAAAGLLVAKFGAQFCYGIDAVSFAVSTLMVAPLAIQRNFETNAQSKSISTVLADLSEGVKFIFTHADVSFVILALTAGMFAISCFGPLMAVYVRDILHASETVFGVVSSLIGIGMIGCTLTIMKFAGARAKTQMVIEGLLTIGVSVVVMACFANLPVTALAMLGVGIGSGLIMVPSQTLIQQSTPVELAGRVASTVWSLLSFAQVIGLVFSGSASQRIGVVKVFYIAAFFLVSIAVFGFYRLSQRSEAAVSQV